MAAVKLAYAEDGQVRRVRLQPPHRMDALLQAAERPPPSGSDDGEFVIVPTLAFSFVDDEGDVCTVSTDAELQEAVRFHESKGLVVRLAVSEGAASGAHVTSWSPRCIDTVTTNSDAASHAAEATAAAGARAKAADASADDLSFTLNGKQVTVTKPDPRLTLLDWLRNIAGLTGTKSSCRQGGCGACTVVMSDPANSASKPVAINACLRPICSIDGMAITTTEGLGNARGGYSNVQNSIAAGNGSQCGFCTPGMVMNMYSLLAANPHPSAADIENHFDGNICRCTGYRPILESFKDSFANPHDCKKQQSSGAAAPLLAVSSTPKTARAHKRFESTGPNDVVWVEPQSLENLQTILWGATQGSQRYRLVAGNTGHGVYADDNVVLYINVTKIQEMTTTTLNSDGTFVFGGAVPISTVMSALESRSKPSDNGHPDYYTVLVTHMKKIANYQVRNVGSWAGNLSMCCQHPTFQSDMATIMQAVDARVQVMDANTSHTSTMTLQDMFALGSMDGKVLLALHVPPPNSSAVLQTYKSMKRHQNAHAYVNAGIYCTFNGSGSEATVAHAVLVYGGIVPKPTRASQTEAYLIGKRLTDPDTVTGALHTLATELVPATDGYFISPEYRLSLAKNFLYKYCIDATLIYGGTVDPTEESARQAWYPRPVSSSTQTFNADSVTCAAIPKLSSWRQAAGEAKYADDHVPRANELFAAYVLSTVAKATVQALDPTAALAIPGVVDFIDASEFGSENICSVGHTGSDGQVIHPQLFAPYSRSTGGHVQYWGQPLGMILAETRELADRAAKAVQVTYADRVNAVVTIQQAIAADGRTERPSHHTAGDAASALSAAAHTFEGSIDISGQYHMYMETQTSVATPMEDDGLFLQVSTQSPASVQNAVAAACDLPQNKVIINMQRAGGGYGGKISNATPIAVACGYAAHKHRRPVRLVTSIKDCLTSTGKRSPWLFNYRVGCDSTGKVTVVTGTVYTAQWRATTDFARCYDIPNWDVTGINCDIDAPRNTWMRSPTELGECTFMNEIMDHVATELNLTAEHVRSINLRPPPPAAQGVSNLPSLFQQLLSSVGISERRAEVERFNSQNKWRKRGLACVPTEYNSGWGGTPSQGALMEVYGDGTILLYVTGCEIGQGLYTKVAQVVALTLGLEDTSLIQVQSTSTNTVPNGGGTGGSTTSGKNCAGAQMAAQTMKTRFDGVRRMMTMQAGGKGDEPWPRSMSKGDWMQLVHAAARAKVDMCVKSWVEGMSVSGNGYCGAVVECEVDILTGENQIIQADVLYDAGKSLSPLIDIGQVEGAFLIGVGHFLTEAIEYDPDNGALLTIDTWEYKPPQSLDIPIVWNTTLLPHAPNPTGFLGSKVVGEPPLICSCAVFFAIKEAVRAAREQNRQNGWFPMRVPATPDVVQQLCPSP